MRFLLLAVFGSLAFGPLEAQEASSSSSPQPTPPYLAPVPENCHWVVNFTYPPGTPPAPPPATYPVSVDTTKVGTTRRILVKFVNSPPQQFDIFGKDCFAQDPPLGLQSRPLGTFLPYTFFDLGFAFTQGVNSGSFKEYTTYRGVPAFHYRDSSNEAWISVETKLPIGADQVGVVKTTYQFLPTPDANAIVPTPEEQRSFQYQKKAEELYNSMR